MADKCRDEIRRNGDQGSGTARLRILLQSECGHALADGFLHSEQTACYDAMPDRVGSHPVSIWADALDSGTYGRAAGFVLERCKFGYSRATAPMNVSDPFSCT